MKVSLSELNACDVTRFVQVCGGFFEHSPWIAERTFAMRPFSSVAGLHAALVATVTSAMVAEQLQLIRSHPDLVGRLAREGKLTRESTSEQAAAGLAGLTAEEIELFEKNNAAYKEKFDFPFVICARENKKAAILAAFPIRLANSREEEITTALAEIAKIARLRLMDAVTES